MAIVSLTLELHIEQAQSLKDRRQVVRSLKEKLRHGFNISVAEMDEAVTWQSATIGVTAVSRSRDYLTGPCSRWGMLACASPMTWAHRWPTHGARSWRKSLRIEFSGSLRGLAKDYFHGGTKGTKVPS